MIDDILSWNAVGKLAVIGFSWAFAWVVSKERL